MFDKYASVNLKFKARIAWEDTPLFMVRIDFDSVRIISLSFINIGEIRVHTFFLFRTVSWTEFYLEKKLLTFIFWKVYLTVKVMSYTHNHLSYRAPWISRYFLQKTSPSTYMLKPLLVTKWGKQVYKLFLAL